MNLSEVRGKINVVDDKMKKLFDERMDCSNQVAAVKMAENDKVFKPLREKEISERFADNEEYLLFIKKVMQISRKRQYKIFKDNNINNQMFLSHMGAMSEVFEKGGILELKLQADKSSVEGLNAKDILSIIADTSLEIQTLTVDEKGVVYVFLQVDDNDRAKSEAYVLAYMLYEETINPR